MMDSAISLVCAINLLPRLHRRLFGGHVLCIADKLLLIWLVCSMLLVHSEWLGNSVLLQKEFQKTLALSYQ